MSDHRVYSTRIAVSFNWYMKMQRSEYSLRRWNGAINTDYKFSWITILWTILHFSAVYTCLAEQELVVSFFSMIMHQPIRTIQTRGHSPQASTSFVRLGSCRFLAAKFETESCPQKGTFDEREDNSTECNNSSQQHFSKWISQSLPCFLLSSPRVCNVRDICK